MIFQRLWNKSDFFAGIFHAYCAIIFTDVDKYSSVRIAAIFADKKRFLTGDAKAASCQKLTTITHYSLIINHFQIINHLKR